MEALPRVGKLNDALGSTREHFLATQRPDGSWGGHVESDPRPTAFYLTTVSQLGRPPDRQTHAMEAYLSSQQLACGAWQAWPGGPEDVDVTAVCVLALDYADTDRGRQARRIGQEWLCGQPFPAPDSFWKGFLALNGLLAWTDLPYLTPRLVTNPDWLHPNIYDFSFLRIAVVCACLLQASQSLAANTSAAVPPSSHNGNPAFEKWKRRWIAEARRPSRGVLALLCHAVWAMDRVFPTAAHRRAAAEWLVMRQESDGSFFSSVHMTSIAVLTLHRLDPVLYGDRVEAGLAAMRAWQVTDERGCRQQFTDSTTWDTILVFDLLQKLGVPRGDIRMQRARDYLLACQNRHLGDWSHRVRTPSPGGWSFQRIGKWYPDNDDTVMAITALLEYDPNTYDTIHPAVRWLLSMQNTNGGWASWDRNDRPWIKIPNGGPWFARDLASPEITARALLLLSRIAKRAYPGLDEFVPAASRALRRGTRWLRQNRHGAAWYGRWFTHYLYGTSQVLEAYRALGWSQDEPIIREALCWLLSVANADGGFGEAPDSGRARRFVTAPSTPFHTACALTAMLQAGASHHPAARRAAQWLLINRSPDGSGWSNYDFFAAGIPGHWYGNFTLTPTYFAAKSLLLFKQSCCAFFQGEANGT